MSLNLSGDVFVVKISIQNASDTAMTLTIGQLTAGTWVLQPGGGGIPLPNTILSPTGALTYFNAAVNAFSPVGGSISFVPADGGSVVVSWGRKQGEALVVNGSVSSDSLTLQCNGINVGTMSPTAQYLITNISD